MSIVNPFYHYVRQESEVIMLQLLSETKLLFYLQNEPKKANYYDIIRHETIRKLAIEYSPDYQFILSSTEKRLGVYDQQKQILIMYDMKTNFQGTFKYKFRYVGVLNDQIIGIRKQAAILIKFNGIYEIKKLPAYLLKEPYHIQLVGKRLFVRRFDQIHVLTFNSAKGFEMKFWIDMISNDIDICYFMLAKTFAYYLFKNGNKFKKVNFSIVPYCLKTQKILNYNQDKVSMQIDGLPIHICYRRLFNKQFDAVIFTEEILQNGLKKFQIAATKRSLIIWYDNIIFVIDH